MSVGHNCPSTNSPVVLVFSFQMVNLTVQLRIVKTDRIENRVGKNSLVKNLLFIC